MNNSIFFLSLARARTQDCYDCSARCITYLDFGCITLKQQHTALWNLTCSIVYTVIGGQYQMYVKVKFKKTLQWAAEELYRGVLLGIGSSCF